MTSTPPPTHAVLIEPRRISVLGTRRGCRVFAEEPLAYYALPDGVELSGTEWNAIEDDGEVYLTGADALLVADQLGDTDHVIYPLLDCHLISAPPVTWEALDHVVARIVRQDEECRLVSIAPTEAKDASNLWLHALPETLLADVHADYRVVSGASTLLGDPSQSGVAWAWIIGEVGISIVASYEGRQLESYVSRNTLPGESDVELASQIERALAASLSLFKEAWASPPDPQIQLRFVTSASEARSAEAAIARSVTKLGLGSDFRGERFSVSELLQQVLAVVTPPISA